MDTVTTLPAIVPVEPQITKNETNFVWNYESIEQYLSSVTAKYAHLVVTDDNVDDMGKVKREVVSLRTHLQKFERATKTKLKKPADDFSLQCRSLYQIIADVEEPLQEQLQQYEDKRIAGVMEAIRREIAAKAQAVGVRDTYLTQVEWNPKWTNKTAKWSETVVEIDHEMVRLKAVQQADDDRQQLLRDRQEMGGMYVVEANTTYRLRTPLEASQVLTEDLLTQGLTDIKAIIFQVAEERKAIEDAVMEPQTVPDTPPLPPLPPLPQNTMPMTGAGDEYKDMIVTIHHVHMGDYDRVCVMLDKLSYPYDVDLR